MNFLLFILKAIFLIKMPKINVFFRNNYLNGFFHLFNILPPPPLPVSTFFCWFCLGHPWYEFLPHCTCQFFLLTLTGLRVKQKTRVHYVLWQQNTFWHYFTFLFFIFSLFYLFLSVIKCLFWCTSLAKVLLN